MIVAKNSLGTRARAGDTGSSHPAINPYTGDLVGASPLSDWEEVNLALDAAESVFAAWSATPFESRQEILRRCANAILAQREELARLMVCEIGKPITLALAEVDRTAITLELAADLQGVGGTELLPLDYDPRGAGTTCNVARFPVGPVFGIVPYNWPLNLAAHKIAPALLAGCPIVIKPSPLGAICTFSLVALLNTCGLPPGALTALLCSNENAERAAQDPRVKMVSFTGSESVGWRLKSLLNDKRVALELGGDASCLVFDDADVEHAAQRIALGAFAHAGQVCISAQHARVHSAVYEDVKELLIQATEDTVSGDPMLEDTVCGPLISDEASDRVMAWIAEAESHGATVLAGGNRIGNVIEPTLIEGVSPTCALATEEAFGPVLTLSRFEKEEEAFDQVNSSRFGIHCSIFTRDQARVARAFSTLDVGGVVVNDFPNLRFDSMPYGGTRRSGFGREGVSYAFEEMTTTRVLLEREV